MRRLSLMVGLMVVACDAANAEACEGDSCKKLVAAAADEAGVANSFDGVWAEAITGESQTCAGTLNVTFKIANNRLVHENSSGTVSPNELGARNRLRGRLYGNMDRAFCWQQCFGPVQAK
jgi:hypothetical protein